MTKDEALKLALEALLWANKEINEWREDAYGYDVIDQPIIMSAATAIKEALANVATEDTSKERVDEMQKQRHEQEPIALPCCGYADASAVKWNPHNQVVQCHNCGQGYTATPQRKPLTDEEIDAVTDSQWAKGVNKPIYAAHRAYARAIEAAHGIKEKNSA